ncbi:pescadillo homolog [Cynara cardunculus var. scolymus]|uniref:pescadillo homolog n=1 Tax=Cynara cardunculus var. scolymus TaxID=59895 RepID=UPI000D62825E|nr:pescadillo homolog [Cynara cardunculus var. scolymus]
MTKKGEIDVVVAAVPITKTEADVPRAKAIEVEVVDETITSHEALEAEVIDKDVRADVEACDKDLPITPSADDGDKEDDDEDDDDDSPTLPDTRKDLGGDDDEDDDDDEFTIQYQKPASIVKGVSLRDSTSQGEKKKEKEKKTSEKDQNTKSKDKGVAEEGKSQGTLQTCCASKYKIFQRYIQGNYTCTKHNIGPHYEVEELYQEPVTTTIPISEIFIDIGPTSRIDIPNNDDENDEYYNEEEDEDDEYHSDDVEEDENDVLGINDDIDSDNDVNEFHNTGDEYRHDPDC